MKPNDSRRLRANGRRGTRRLAGGALVTVATLATALGLLAGAYAPVLDYALAAAGGPGDCNNDGVVDAGDISAIVLEIFDGDGNLASECGGGSFLGDPEGCDTNGDGVIDAGDISCTILRIFGGPGACGPPPTSTPTASTTPSPTTTASPTPSPGPTATPTLGPPPDTPFGVQIFEYEAKEPVLTSLNQAGARFVRVRLLWDRIEPVDAQPPLRDWTTPDEVIREVTARGFEPLVVIYGHPSWAASHPCGPIDLAPLQRFADFVSAAVERYDGDGTNDADGSPRVGLWQIGNEADFNLDFAAGEPDYGSCFGGRSAAYGAYLRAAFRAVKATDPTAGVVFAGVAYERFYNKAGYSPTGPFDYLFVGNVLEWLFTNHGAEPEWPFFNWMAVHVYNDFRNNWDRTQPYDQEMVGKLRHLRDNQLVSVGKFDLRSRPVAVTEVSIPSMPSDAFTDRSESIQAAYPGQVVARALASGAAVAIWFSAEDHRLGRCSAPYDWIGVGLLRSKRVYDAARLCSPNPIPDYYVEEDHEPKPAATAAGVATSLLSGAALDRQLTPAETGSSQIEAYRVLLPDGTHTVVAFTDHGERLGRVGVPPLERVMTFDAGILPEWTGELLVTDHLGASTVLSGESIAVTITQWPKYVRVR